MVSLKNLQRTMFDGVLITDEPAGTILDVIESKIIKGAYYIVTPNVDHFYRLGVDANPSFVKAYQNADLKVCDSRIIQKLSALESKAIRYVSPGSDLTKSMLESDWIDNFKLLVVGPAEHEACLVGEKYSLKTLSCYTPPMGFIRDELEVKKCIDAIVLSEADIVFLAVGSPQQEILAERVKELINNGTNGKDVAMVCVGASFDFLSGKARRAPYLLQALHMEWLHRMLCNPTRLIPRYWKNFCWILTFLRRKLLSK